MEKRGSLERTYIVSMLWVATVIASPAQTFTMLHGFDVTDGSNPQYGLVRGTDGNLYGTTIYGGANLSCGAGNGCGTVFQITPEGTLTTLHSFDGTDGESPVSLVQGSDGKFYGATTYGGIGSYCNPSGTCGTIFTIVPGGTPVTLYNFCSQAACADGSYPNGGLVQGTDGNFYGTTDSGGVNFGGTVFKITPAGTLTTLYSFTQNSQIINPPAPGFGPSGTLVQGADGNFYGSTASGGLSNCGLDQPLYCGTIFKITPAGTLTTLYSFCAQTYCPDGFGSSALVQGNDGNFYGSTVGGGGTQTGYPFGDGTVFKITPTGTLTTLHVFEGTDGAAPLGVIQGTDGNFYGTTSAGGGSNDGTLFKMTPAGTLITLYSFDGTDGQLPNGLLQATGGPFYGTTEIGGANKDGTVFSFAIGLGGTAVSTTSLGLSPVSITVGSAGPVVITATVAPTSGSGTPTGVVAFFNGSNEVGFANLSGGVATYNYNPSSLAINTYQITAIYSGDTTFAMSTASAETLTITVLPLAATPTFSPAPGTYNATQTVTISDTTSGAAVYFTNDGTTPTTSSAVYSAPITVDSTETLKAIAAAGGFSNSAVATAAYTISLSPDYQLSITPSSLTIVAGQSGTAKFTVTPMNGFSSQVTFTCSGLPAEATCSFDPPSVTPSGGNPLSSTVTINTTAASAVLRGPRPSSSYLSYALLIPCLGVIFGITTGRKRNFHGLRVFGMFALLVLAAGLTSCGSSSKAGNPGNPGTPAGARTITVTASTSGTGAINHSAALTITITQ